LILGIDETAEDFGIDGAIFTERGQENVRFPKDIAAHEDIAGVSALQFQPGKDKMRCRGPNIHTNASQDNTVLFN
jgi:hypothetical protein